MEGQQGLCVVMHHMSLCAYVCVEREKLKTKQGQIMLWYTDVILVLNSIVNVCTCTCINLYLRLQ